MSSDLKTKHEVTVNTSLGVFVLNHATNFFFLNYLGDNDGWEMQPLGTTLRVQEGK